MKLVFMGTPDFSVPTLEKIIESKHEIALVVTQPDRPKGRSGKPAFSPVKECAIAHNIKVSQPERIRGNEEFINELREINPDAIIVIAFGQILPKEVIEMPKYGCINIHASILPKYRGAAPIQWAVIDGLKETGVTIMAMDEGLDTGDILEVGKLELDKEETGGSLFDKLSFMGGPLLLETLDKFEAGTIERVKQNDEESTYAKKLSKQTGEIDFNMSAVDIERLVRGLNPWPSAYTHMNGKMLKIWKSEVVESIDDINGFVKKEGFNNEPSEVAGKTKNALYVKCKDNYLAIYELQLEGKKRMDTTSFLLGYNLEDIPSKLS